MTSKVILVVDDEPGLLAIYRRALEHHGYVVLTAESGAEALEILDGHPQPIDLVLSDIVMPGISGRELVWRVLETHPTTRIILASGFTDEGGALQMMEDRGVVFLPKPLDLDFMLDVIREKVGAATGG